VKIAAIIAAGGIGSRMGAGSSKQMMMLAGKPVLAHTAAIFQDASEISEIVIVIDAADVERCREEVVARHGLDKVSAVVAGGENRALSVLNGMRVLGPEAGAVLVHDGARPLLPEELLHSGISEFAVSSSGGHGGRASSESAVSSCDGVVFGIPVTDTIKEIEPETRIVATTPDRSRLWAAQTPQLFTRSVFESAYDAADEVLADATDDASLVERAGGVVKMVMGSPENIKLTTPMDVLVAEEILRRRGN